MDNVQVIIAYTNMNTIVSDPTERQKFLNVARKWLELPDNTNTTQIIWNKCNTNWVLKADESMRCFVFVSDSGPGRQLVNPNTMDELADAIVALGPSPTKAEILDELETYSSGQYDIKKARNYLATNFIWFTRHAKMVVLQYCNKP